MKYKSYREIMEAMNRGEIPRQHLGPQTFETLKAYLFGLKNEYKPQAFTEDELNDWNKRLAAIKDEIEKLSPSEKDRLIKEVDDMLNP